jgi:hypothetical protein
VEDLPKTLDSISYLGFDGELHFQGRYAVDFDSFIHDIHFEVKEESAVRFYVAPHEVDIDLWLYPTGSSHYIQVSVTHPDPLGSFKAPACRLPFLTPLQHSSLDVNTEEVIFATLPGPGNYYLRLIFFGTLRVLLLWSSAQIVRVIFDQSNKKCCIIIVPMNISGQYLWSIKISKKKKRWYHVLLTLCQAEMLRLDLVPA